MKSKHDVLVIGGGPVGLSCAYYLLKSGRQVTIIDANEIGKGSGHGNAGQIVPSHIIPLAAPGVVTSALKWMFSPSTSPFGLKIRIDPKYIAWLIQFAAACSEGNVQRNLPSMRSLGQLSAENLLTILAEEKIECHYQQTGIITLFKDEKAFLEGKHESEFLGKNGVPTEILDKATLHEREPIALDDVIGGVHFTGDSFMNPASFLAELAKRVRAMGAEILEHTPVTGFESAGGKITKVRTTSGEFEAEHVVLAAGAWSSIVARDLRLKLPLQPARGYSVTVAAPGKMPRHAFILGDRRVAVSPFGDLLRFTGRLEVGEYSTTPDPKWLARLEKFVREYIELDETLDVKETWAGLRPVTPDGVPVIGRAPHLSNLIVATGHAMVGLSLGPGTGQLVAELVNGRAPAFDLRPLGLERF